MAGNFLDRQEIASRLHLVAAHGTRQQHPEQPRFMQPCQKRLGNASRAFDRIGCGGDRRPQVAGHRERVRRVSGIHAPPLG